MRRALTHIVFTAVTLCAITRAAADSIAPAPFAQAREAAPERAVQIGDTWLGLIHEHEPHDRFRLVTLVSQGGAWTTARSRIIGDEYVYYTLADGPSAVNLAGREYAYFSFSVTRQGTAYAGLGEVEFRLADVRTLEDFTLLYDGELRGEKVKGEAVPDAALSKRPELLQFLNTKLAASPLVLQATDKDPLAWLDLWRAMNPKLDDLRPQGFGRMPISWPLFDTDPMAGEPDGSESGSKENARYRVRSFFRSSVIGYDKKARKYFPIWAERCAHGCNKTLVVLNGNVLSFRFDEWEPAFVVTINLNLRTAEGFPAE